MPDVVAVHESQLLLHQVLEHVDEGVVLRARLAPPVQVPLDHEVDGLDGRKVRRIRLPPDLERGLPLGAKPDPRDRPDVGAQAQHLRHLGPFRVHDPEDRRPGVQARRLGEDLLDRQGIGARIEQEVAAAGVRDQRLHLRVAVEVVADDQPRVGHGQMRHARRGDGVPRLVAVLEDDEGDRRLERPQHVAIAGR